MHQWVRIPNVLALRGASVTAATAATAAELLAPEILRLEPILPHLLGNSLKT